MRRILAVIPAFRNPVQLERCLDHLRRQTVAPRIDIYVRDNSEQNIYYTAAINEGMRHGLGVPEVDAFLLLNQDCYLEPPAVEALVACMESNPAVGICAPLQVEVGDPEAVIWGGAERAFPNGQCFKGRLREIGPPFETPWAEGAAMLVRRQLAREIGLLDENMRLFCSDADYSFAARARGWKVVVVPAARGAHERGVTKGDPADGETMWIMRQDLVYFADKWITGIRYRELAIERAPIDLGNLREKRDRMARQLSDGGHPLRHSTS